MTLLFLDLILSYRAQAWSLASNFAVMSAVHITPFFASWDLQSETHHNFRWKKMGKGFAGRNQKGHFWF